MAIRREGSQPPFYYYYYFFILFLAVLGLRFCARTFSTYGKRGPLFIVVRGPLTIVASLVAEHRLRRAGSVVVAHGLSCSAAYGIFPDQGSNPCPLHWQADSQPLRHQGSPPKVFLSWVWCEHSWEQNMTWINRRLLPLWCILLSFIAEISMYLITGFWSRPNWKN